MRLAHVSKPLDITTGAHRQPEHVPGSGIATGFLVENRVPIGAPGELHCREQGGDAQHGNGQAGIAGTEKGVGEEHQVDKLAHADFDEGQARAQDQSHVRRDEENRDRGGEHEGVVD